MDARQRRADMGILAVGEPHAMHAFAGKLEITDLAWLGGFLDAVNFDPRFVGHAGRNRLIEVRPLLVLDQDVAGDLHFMRVGVGRVGHLP